MNYADGARCYATGRECVLGVKGRSAGSLDGECSLFGMFDVWITQNDDLLISDIGAPSDEPKRCLALGINRALAEEIARSRSARRGTRVLTTQRRCLACNGSFWMTDHRGPFGLAEYGHGHLCPQCIGKATDERVLEKLGSLRYWCG